MKTQLSILFSNPMSVNYHDPFANLILLGPVIKYAHDPFSCPYYLPPLASLGKRQNQLSKTTSFLLASKETGTNQSLLDTFVQPTKILQVTPNLHL